MAAAAAAAASPSDSPAPAPAVAVDRASCDETLSLRALRVPAPRVGSLMKTLRRHLLNRPRTKNVLHDPSLATTRLLLLSPAVASEDLRELPSEARAAIDATEGVSVVSHELLLPYADLSVEQALRKLLPAEIRELPQSFETAGHVAHLNLREEALPYKGLIAQVVLDKNFPRIRTVVNKVGVIESKFRTLPLEVLVGDRDLEVTVKESNSTFTFDYATVYWNSRLQTEHKRLVERIPSGAVVADVFAGVGPFSVPLASQRGCTVHANDLNPDSHKWLVHNTRANRCEANLTTYNLDGGAFVAAMADADVAASHILMNLPKHALHFLRAFRGRSVGRADATVHVHCFSKAEDPAADAVTRASEALGVPLERASVDVTQVRDVAPKKVMLCLAFTVPEAVRALPRCAAGDIDAAIAAADAAEAHANEAARAAGRARVAAAAADEEAPAAKRAKTD